MKLKPYALKKITGRDNMISNTKTHKKQKYNMQRINQKWDKIIKNIFKPSYPIEINFFRFCLYLKKDLYMVYGKKDIGKIKTMYIKDYNRWVQYNKVVKPYPTGQYEKHFLGNA